MSTYTLLLGLPTVSVFGLLPLLLAEPAMGGNEGTELTLLFLPELGSEALHEKRLSRFSTQPWWTKWLRNLNIWTHTVDGHVATMAENIPSNAAQRSVAPRPRVVVLPGGTSLDKQRAADRWRRSNAAWYTNDNKCKNKVFPSEKIPRNLGLKAWIWSSSLVCSLCYDF